MDLRALAPILQHSLGTTRADMILRPPQPATPYEAADGLPCAILTPSNVQPSQAAARWRSWILPAAVSPATRISYETPWRALVTYAVAFHREHELLPTSKQLLEAFFTCIAAADLSAGTARRYLAGLHAKHRDLHLPFPLSAAERSRWGKALNTGHARQQPLVAPVTAHMVRAALRLPVHSAEACQDVMALALATLLGCRPSDLVNIDVCDFLLDFLNDPPNTAAFRIRAMKNDAQRKGHFPRIGAPKHPSNDIIARLLHWCRTYNLRPQPTCTKPLRPTAPCHACGTLFRRLHNQKPLPTADPAHAWSYDNFLSAVRRVATRLHMDPNAFTGRSCRYGALSIAADAGLPEYLVTVQTGHKQPAASNASARGYMLVTHPRALFQFYDLFQL